MVVESLKRERGGEESSCSLLPVMANPPIFSFGDSSRSAFSPYKPSVTVLTNLQRGNTKAKLNQHSKEHHDSFFQLAAKGELTSEQIRNQDNLDVFDCDDYGLTALMWASAYGQCHTCEDLLAAGAHVDVHNAEGQTALHFAAKSGYPEVIKVLISFGADVNFPDEHGNTALIFACRDNHPLTVSFLLTNGADFTLANVYASTAYNEAIIQKNFEVQQILEIHMKQLLTEDVPSSW